jgi:hypothetical protein
MLPLLLKSNIARLRESGAAHMPRIEGKISNHLGFIDFHLRGRDYLLGDELPGQIFN